MHADRRCRPRRGSALIEVLVATVILATAGTALLTMLGQTQHTMRTVRTTERSINSASAELDRLVLLDRAALSAREGWSSHGGWSLRIVRVAPALFDVSVAADPSQPALLATTIYRPDTTDAR